MSARNSRCELTAPADPTQNGRVPSGWLATDAIQIRGHVVDPRRPTVDIAWLVGIQTRPAAVKKVHLESCIRE
jgi:hypothetical protein